MQYTLRNVLRKYKMDELVSPLFYCLPVGLRFVSDEKSAKKRVSAVAAELFAGEMLAVLETEPEAAFEALAKGAEHISEPRERYDPEDGSLTPYTRHYYKFEKPPFEKLADVALRHAEHYRGRMFWVEPESGIILAVYDSRGFDVAAPRKEPLVRLYKRRKEWLSEIDFPQMRLNFED